MNRFIKTLLIIFALNALLNANSVSNSVKYVKTLIKSSKALEPYVIKELAKIVAKQGTKKLGKVLGKMKLPNEALEDTFMRLAIYQEKITRKEAEKMMRNLKGAKGFRTTLRKVIGNSKKKTSGHLHELRLANTASKNGFKVISIGEQFSDGVKKGATDIDIIFKRKNKLFAIEAKDYINPSTLKTDDIRGDMKSLLEFAKQNPSKNIIPVYSITTKPTSEKTLKRLMKIAEKFGVQLIFGNPQEQIEQIKLLGDIL